MARIKRTVPILSCRIVEESRMERCHPSRRPLPPSVSVSRPPAKSDLRMVFYGAWIAMGLVVMSVGFGQMASNGKDPLVRASLPHVSLPVFLQKVE